MLRLLARRPAWCSEAVKKRPRNGPQNGTKSMKKRSKTKLKKYPKMTRKRPQNGSHLGPRRLQAGSGSLRGPSRNPSNSAKEPSRATSGLQEPPGTLQGVILTSPGAVWWNILTPLKGQKTSRMLKSLLGCVCLKSSGPSGLRRVKIYLRSSDHKSIES